MKKRFLIIAMVAAIACLLAISASAATIYYNDESGNTLFVGVDENNDRVFETYSGSFPNTDEGGNALTWYITETNVQGDDTVHTVESFLTIDTTGEHASLSEKGVYKYVNKDREISIVSAYFPNNSNILTLSLSDSGYGTAYNYESDKSNILFLTLPNTLTEMPSRLGQATPLIDCTIDDGALTPSYGATVFYMAKNLRSVDIPAAVTILYSNGHQNDGFPFFNCVSLVDVHFAPDSKLETIQTNAFNSCTALKEITVPNSVINLSARAFQNCKSLETVRLGANVGKGLETYNVQSMFYLCDSLKYLYFSETMVPTTGSHMFNGGTSGMVYFYTGNFEQYEAFKAILVTLKDSTKFTNATPIEWDSTKSDQYYKDLAAADNKNYVVYGYGKCEAFYGGHSWKGETNVIFESYFDDIGIGDTCANCGKAEAKEIIKAIFEWKGYSASTYGESLSLTQGFGINHESVEAYREYAPDFDFGIFATVNKTGGAYTPDFASDSVIHINFNKAANSLIDVKVTGIPSNKGDSLIVFCAYVKDGAKTYYLDGGKTTSTVTGISYNEIANN